MKMAGKKKKFGQYSAILTLHWVSSPYAVYCFDDSGLKSNGALFPVVVLSHHLTSLKTFSQIWIPSLKSLVKSI